MNRPFSMNFGGLTCRNGRQTLTWTGKIEPQLSEGVARADNVK